MSFSVIQPAGIRNWFPQSINRLQRFSLLFLSVAGFSDLCDKIKYDKNKDTKFYRTEGISLKWLFFDSTAESRIYNPINSLWWNFFCKNS